MYSSSFQNSENNCIKSIKKWFDCLKPPHKRLDPILSQDLNNYLFADGHHSTATKTTGITSVRGNKYKFRNKHNRLDSKSRSNSEDLGVYQPPHPEIIITESYESINSSDDDSSDDLKLSNSSIRQLITANSLQVSVE